MKKIVIIEDDLAISQMYRMKFETDGFEVYLADNGQSGVDLVKTVQPDIVLLDLLMPELSGQQTLAEIRADQNIANTPVIILTNTESEQAEIEAQQLGIEAYIIKANETPTQVVTKTKEVLGI